MPDRDFPAPGVVTVDRPVSSEELRSLKARWDAFAQAAAHWGISSHELDCPTTHSDLVRVESTVDPSQTLAWLCLGCDRQLPANWTT